MEYKASISKLTQPLVKELIENADKFRVDVQNMENGCTIVDAGISAPGGIAAGRLITEICMGGMGTVTISHRPSGILTPQTCQNWITSMDVNG